MTVLYSKYFADCPNVRPRKVVKKSVTKKFTVMVVVGESVLFVIVKFCISAMIHIFIVYVDFTYIFVHFYEAYI